MTRVCNTVCACRGDTPLHIAAARGDVPLVTALLAGAGAADPSAAGIGTAMCAGVDVRVRVRVRVRACVFACWRTCSVPLVGDSAAGGSGLIVLQASVGMWASHALRPCMHAATTRGGVDKPWRRPNPSSLAQPSVFGHRRLRSLWDQVVRSSHTTPRDIHLLQVPPEASPLHIYVYICVYTVYICILTLYCIPTAGAPGGLTAAPSMRASGGSVRASGGSVAGGARGVSAVSFYGHEQCTSF